jgi:hypothetical protein
MRIESEEHRLSPTLIRFGEVVRLRFWLEGQQWGGSMLERILKRAALLLFYFSCV